MLTYTTKEGKTIYLAELCWFEGINTPFLRTDENHYLATTEKEDLPFPQIRVLYVDTKTQKTEKRSWTILPLWFTIVEKPSTSYIVKINKDAIADMLSSKTSAEVEEILKEEFRRLKEFFLKNLCGFLDAGF